MGNPKLKATNAFAGAGVKTGIANPNAAIARLAPIPAMVRVLGSLFIAFPKMLVPYSNTSSNITVSFGAGNRDAGMVASACPIALRA
jgi:hypothetical protein